MILLVVHPSCSFSWSIHAMYRAHGERLAMITVLRREAYSYCRSIIQPSCLVHHSRTYISIQSILHSLLPKRFRSHSIPRPVHSALLAARSSLEAFAIAEAVVFTISKTVELKSRAASSASGIWVGVPGRGRNQLLPKSKKQRSDQLQEVRKRMRRRIEQ